jgi:hypothetical protein
MNFSGDRICERFPLIEACLRKQATKAYMSGDKLHAFLISALNCGK